jgi:hypothetical protein
MTRLMRLLEILVGVAASTVSEEELANWVSARIRRSRLDTLHTGN